MMRTKRKTPRTPRRAPSLRRARRFIETRERIYRAALRLFSDRGYMATTIEDITEAADVGKGTFFNYFPSKEHVLATFGDQRLASYQRALEQVRARDCTVGDVLCRTVSELATLDKGDARLFRSIFVAHASSDLVCEHFRDRVCEWREIIMEMLRIGQEHGEVRRDCDTRETARLIQQAMMGLTMAWAMNPDEPLLKTSQQLWQALWDSFKSDRGIRARA